MTSKEKRNGCILGIFFGGLSLFSVGLAYLVISISTPAGSPMAQLYRTEVGLTALVKAVETYKNDLGVYPPAGQEGLLLAARHLSRNANYMPEEQQLDSWGHPYVYVPASDYAKPGSGAMKDRDTYFAPDTFQIYSVGMDGDAGDEAPLRRKDNITSWEPDRPWRPTYKDRHKEYFLKKGTRQ